MNRVWPPALLLLTLFGLGGSAHAKGPEGVAAKNIGNVARQSPAKATQPKSVVAKANTTQPSRAAPVKKPPTKAAPTKPSAKKPVANKKAAPKLGKQQSKGACLARPVQLIRVRGEQLEPHAVSLTTCAGAPNVAALDELSILARPRDVERPTPAELRAYRAKPIAKGKVAKRNAHKFRNPAFVSARVMRVHKGLLQRLQKVANRYPGRAIEVISGYRPDARETSRHYHGRALDLRVSGITREQLVTFLRGVEDTGVGYYPNSYFVHMDVRDAKAYWVDRSGPGEPADYGPWPLEKQPMERERDHVVKGALAALTALDEPVFRATDPHSTKVVASKKMVRPAEPTESDEMSADELKRVRAEARRALDQL
jgi:hypothetical protein